MQNRENRLIIKVKTSIYVAIALLVLLATAVISPLTRSFAVQAFGLFLFASVAVATLRQTSLWASRPAPGALFWCFILAAALALVIGFYLDGYDFVPTWDEIGYWRTTLQFNEGLSSSVSTTLRNMVQSVWGDDYNQLMAWVLSPVARVFPTWAAFACVTTMLFNVPAAFVIALFVQHKVQGGGTHKRDAWTLPAVFAFALFFPAALRPGLTGLVDAPAYLLFVLALVTILDDRVLESRPLQALGALCLCGSFLLRRYMLYGAMGLASGAVVYWGSRLIFQRGVDRLGYFKRLVSVLFVYLSVVALTAVLFFGFYYRSLFGGQTVAYQSWTYIDSLADKLSAVIQQTGSVWFLLAALALVLLFAHNRRGASSSVGAVPLAVISLFVSCGVSLLAFWQVQDLGSQHWYVFVGQLTSLLALPIAALLTTLRPALRGALAVSWGALSLVGLLAGLSWLPDSLAAPVSALLPWRIHAPIVQSDVAEKQRLTRWLEDQTGGEELVYFAAASGDLNATLPAGCVLPHSAWDPFPVASADVDSRDGFNTAFFDAEYVVTSDPVSLHMVPENERVVVTLNNLVRDGESYVGRHYELAASFEFDDGVSVDVYRRVSDFSRDDVLELQAAFDEVYPDNPELFHDRFEAYLEGMGR